MSTEVSILNQAFEGHPVRISVRANVPWFVLNDVCRVLEIENPRNIARRLDADERDVHSMDTLGGKQRQTVVNESGLYACIMESRKPAAKRFSKWVRSEVLPALLKTGSYTMPGREPEPETVSDNPFDMLAAQLDAATPGPGIPTLPLFPAYDPFQQPFRDSREVLSRHGWQLAERAQRQVQAKLAIFLELVWERQPDADVDAVCRWASAHPEILDHPAIWARAFAKTQKMRQLT